MTNWTPLPGARQPRAEGESYAPIYKWKKEVGEAVEGILRAVRAGQYGLLGEIGDLVVPLKGYCQQGKVGDVVSKLPLGTLIRIEFIGTRENKNPRLHPSNIFEIYTQAPQASAGAPTVPSVADLEMKLKVKLGSGPANELITMLKRMFPANYAAQLAEVAKQHGIDDEEVPFSMQGHFLSDERR